MVSNENEPVPEPSEQQPADGEQETATGQAAPADQAGAGPAGGAHTPDQPDAALQDAPSEQAGAEQAGAEQAGAEQAGAEQAIGAHTPDEPAAWQATPAARGTAGQVGPVVEPQGRPVPAPTWRRPVVSLLVALFAAYLLYRILRDGRLEQSAAFYVGLPAVLAIVVAATARPRGAVGSAVVATTIGLALAGPLLGEGVICLVFSAPLFYLIAIFVAIGIESGGRSGHRGIAAIAIVPVLLMCLEGVSPATSMPRGEQVVSERIVQAAPGEVEAALARTPAYGRPSSAFLRLGFPRPLHATGEGLDVGDERFVTFTPRRSLGIGAKPTPRSMRLRVTESEPGRVVFTIVQDSTAARWLDFDTAEVTWHIAGATSTTVRWTLRYRRTFDPAWYFGPLQRYGMTQVADYLNVTVTRPADA
jgi:hypothetical protein